MTKCGAQRYIAYTCGQSHQILIITVYSGITDEETDSEKFCNFPQGHITNEWGFEPKSDCIFYLTREPLA